MVSILRNLQTEWNSLVPEAQARGIRRVRLLNGPLETIEYRRTRLEWLRAQLGTTLLTTVADGPLGDIDQFTFGVEAELIMPVGMTSVELAALITQAGVECHDESYNHTNRSHWKVVTDGSLGDYTRGREVVSPKLQGQVGFDAIRKVFKAIEQAGCKVSKKCGLHVHVGAKNQPIQFFKNLVVLYASAETAIDSFMAPSRRGAQGGNGFCKSVRVSRVRLNEAITVDQVAQAIYQTPGAAHARSSGRYCKLNLQSYWAHGTVEFRHHQGTVEAQKVENWVRLCLRMALTAKGTEKTANTVEELMQAVEATDAEAEFFHGRVRRFNSGASATVVRRPRAPVQAEPRVEATPVAPAPAAPDQSGVFTSYGDFAQTAPRNR